MERLYAWPLGLLTICATAQNTVVLPVHPEEKHGYHQPCVKGERGTPKGNAFFTESFDNDLNGWTATSDEGTVVWHWSNTGPGPTSSQYPVPPLNTTAGWAIFDDDFEGESGQFNESSLVSPTIDLSSAPVNLRLSFDQYYQVFDEDLVDVWVGVSTDDGATWDDILINDGVGRDGRPNPEAMDVNISDLVAANPANVRIRFRYAATWDYGWQVDNIAIDELPENDMALLSAFPTAFDFTNTGSDSQPYTIYPQAHLVAMEATAKVKNKGYMAQTGVVSSMTITGPNSDDFNSTAVPTDVDPGLEYTEIFEPFQPNGELGDYQVDFAITQNEVDEVPDNNALTRYYTVSANTYALDNGAVTSFQRQTPDNLGENYELGLKFQFQVDDQITAVQAAIHSSTPTGGLIYGAVYDLAADNTSHPSLRGDPTTEHTIEAADLNDIGGSTFVTMPFQNPIDVFQGEVVQVMVGTFQPSDSVRIATSGFVPLQIALIHYPSLDANMQFTLTKTPMVRAVLASGPIGIAEQDGLISVVQAGPNPFNTGCDLRFELARAANVRVELHDALGRQVLSEALGTLSAGQQTYRVDGAGLGEGIYLYSVIINGVRHTGKVQLTK